MDLKCEHCEEPITEPMEYRWKNQSVLVNACDKYCAHDIKNIEDLFITLGIIDENYPEIEEQNEILKEMEEPDLGFV